MQKSISYCMEAKTIKYRGVRETGNKTRASERNKEETIEVFWSH